jgi:hypothetical protein
MMFKNSFMTKAGLSRSSPTKGRSAAETNGFRFQRRSAAHPVAGLIDFRWAIGRLVMNIIDQVTIPPSNLVGLTLSRFMKRFDEAAGEGGKRNNDMPDKVRRHWTGEARAACLSLNDCLQ